MFTLAAKMDPCAELFLAYNKLSHKPKGLPI